jgi:hypothetical protein
MPQNWENRVKIDQNRQKALRERLRNGSNASHPQSNTMRPTICMHTTKSGQNRLKNAPETAEERLKRFAHAIEHD